MRISNTTELKVLAKTARKSTDGSKEYYNLAVIQGGECGNVSCTKDVFDVVLEDNAYLFETIFNTEYKSISFARVLQEKPSRSSGGSASSK